MNTYVTDEKPTSIIVSFSKEGKCFLHPSGIKQFISLADLELKKTMLELEKNRIISEIDAISLDIEKIKGA